MRGTSGESLRTAHPGGYPRGRRPRRAVVAAAAALLAAVGAAGCTGHAPASAPGGAASSPAASGAGHSTATAAVPLSWSAARAPLPAEASGVSDQSAALTDVSCVDAGDCVAVGSDRATGAAGEVFQGLVETLSGGTWTPTALPDVSTPSKDGYVSLAAVSCPARGNCVAVGSVYSGAGTNTPVIETLSGGRWASVKAPLPGDAAAGAGANLDGVACPAVGTCVATGYYGNQAGEHDGYIDTLANGTWTAADGPLPADAAPEQSTSGASTFLTDVACPQAGTCAASGQYMDTHGQVEPFIATLSGGTWSAVSAPLPADAAATGQDAALWAIACPAARACIAAGHYIVGGQPRYLVETQSGGAWTASALSLPADAAADQKWSQDQSTTIGGLACESAGACVATAGYVTKANEVLPLYETLSGGMWTAATVPLPPDAAPATGVSNATYLVLVTCPAAGHCLSAGSYPATDGTTEGLIETAVPR
jgi:hypothetical protein